MKGDTTHYINMYTGRRGTTEWGDKSQHYGTTCVGVLHESWHIMAAHASQCSECAGCSIRRRYGYGKTEGWPINSTFANMTVRKRAFCRKCDDGPAADRRSSQSLL